MESHSLLLARGRFNMYSARLGGCSCFTGIDFKLRSPNIRRIRNPTSSLVLTLPQACQSLAMPETEVVGQRLRRATGFGVVQRMADTLPGRNSFLSAYVQIITPSPLPRAPPSFPLSCSYLVARWSRSWSIHLSDLTSSVLPAAVRLTARHATAIGTYRHLSGAPDWAKGKPDCPAVPTET